MSRYPGIKLAIFTKAPVSGAVKTRMQPKLPPAFSLALHKRLIDFLLTQLLSANICPLSLWLAGEKEILQKQLPHWHHVHTNQQSGNDLGQRLANAAIVELENCDALLLIGTDCPFIDKDYLEKACAAIIDYDVVIGPATDGGYVLLGIKNYMPQLFEGISWGESSVFQQTLDAVNRLNLNYYLLPTLPDIDYPADLEHLISLSFFKPLLEEWSLDH